MNASEPVPLLRGGRDSTLVIHDHLRARILSGELPAGGELAQAQVAKDYGVSRAPVREAFRLLEREGLIASQVNHRARVTDLSPDDVEHAYALRVANEALALAVSVPRFGPADLLGLEELLASLGHPRRVGFEAWESAHHRFHMALLAPAGARMAESASRWAEHTARYRRVYVGDDNGGWRQGASEHAELVRLCRAGDVPAATRLLARHLSRAALTLLATMDPAHEPALLRAAVRQVADAADAASARR